jgi:hypothetical protein
MEQMTECLLAKMDPHLQEIKSGHEQMTAEIKTN